MEVGRPTRKLLQLVVQVRDLDQGGEDSEAMAFGDKVDSTSRTVAGTEGEGESVRDDFSVSCWLEAEPSRRLMNKQNPGIWPMSGAHS